MPIPGTGVRHGNQLAALVERPDSPKVEFMADGVVMITRRYAIDSGSDIAMAPKPKDLDPLGYNARCVSTQVVHGVQNQSEIISTFQGYTSLPPNIYEFANSRLDRPIAMHPNFNDPSIFPPSTKVYEPIPPFTEKSMVAPTDASPYGGKGCVFSKFQDVGDSLNDPKIKFRGVEAYIVGSAQFRKTAYATEPDFDQTDVGKLSAPESGPYWMTLPDPTNSGKHWLKIEKTCVNMLKGASILWTITEVWQYNDLGWLSEIYEP